MIDPTTLRTLCEQATPGPWEARFCEADAEWPPTVAGKYRRRYHWRTELRARAFPVSPSGATHE